jgi:hypothetical protein
MAIVTKKVEFFCEPSALECRGHIREEPRSDEEFLEDRWGRKKRVADCMNEAIFCFEVRRHNFAE